MTECECCQTHEPECDSYEADMEILRVEVARIRKELDTRTYQRDQARKQVAALRDMLNARTHQRDRAEEERDAARAIVANVRRAMDAMARKTMNPKAHGVNHDDQSDRQPQGTRSHHRLCR